MYVQERSKVKSLLVIHVPILSDIRNSLFLGHLGFDCILCMMLGLVLLAHYLHTCRYHNEECTTSTAVSPLVSGGGPV